MTVIITGDALAEYAREMEDLKIEDDALAEEEKKIKERREEIKERVRAVALVAGHEKERTVIPAGDMGAWDRQVTMKDEGLNLAELEELLGQSTYRDLVCVKQEHYVASQEKLEAARLAGQISDEYIQLCMAEGTPSYSVQKLTTKQLETLQKAQS